MTKNIQLNPSVTVSYAERPAIEGQPDAPNKAVTVSSLTVRQSIDDPINKKVSVLFFETRFPVVIWEGEAYDAAGQWTDTQLADAVAAKIAADAEAVVAEAMTFPARPTPEAMMARAERIKAQFPNGLPRPAWIPQAQAPHGGLDGKVTIS